MNKRPQTRHLTPLPKSAPPNVNAGCEPVYSPTQSQLSPTLREDFRGAKKPTLGGRVPITCSFFD